MVQGDQGHSVGNSPGRGEHRPLGPTERGREQEGHEHADSFVPEPVVDPHRFHIIRTAIAAALEHDHERVEIYQHVLMQLEARFRELDAVIEVARWMPFGDAKALQLFRAWMGRANDAVAPGAVLTGEPPSSNRDLSVSMQPIPSVLNWEPLLDLHIAAAYSAGVDHELRQQQVTLVSHVVRELASVIDLLHHFAKEYLEERSRPVDVLQILEAFGHGKPIPKFPSQHDECHMALQGVMMSSGSALARSMEAIEIDGNTDRIAQIVPNTVCVPNQVALRASPAAQFDPIPPPSIGVYVNGIQGTIDRWDPLEIQVTFPENARSGHVWLQKVPAATGIGSSIVEDMQALSACPMFAGGMIGRGSALASAYLGLPHRIQPLRLPDHRRPETFLTVRHKPAIVLFSAIDNRGQQITGINPAPACTEVKLRWNVLSDDPALVQIKILRQGSVVLSGLSPLGSTVIHPDAYQQLTLQAQNGCGISTRDLDLEVRPPVLRVEPARLALLPGQQAVLSFSFSCPVKNNTTVSFMSSDPAKVTVTPSVMISAGLSQGQASVTGMAAGKAEQAAATVTVSAPGYDSQKVMVWVENPQGEWNVVNDPADPTKELDLPLLAIHAVLLRTGKVLFFAGDENDPNALDKVKMVLWDPPAGGYTDIAATMPAPRNLFCSGHAFLADGRLLVAGGHAHSPAQNLSEEAIGAIIGGILLGGAVGGAATGATIGVTIGRGVDHDIHVYDPVRSAWTRHRDMDKARWYPTCVTLPDGRILIVSGYCAGAPPHPFTLFGAPVNEDYDLFDPATGDLVIIKDRRFLSGIDLYPRLQVLPGGVLFVHSRNRTVLFYPDANVTAPLSMTPSPTQYFTLSPNRRTYPLQGACVLLPLIPEAPRNVRVMVIGGGNEVNTTISWTNPATHTAEIFDFDPTLDQTMPQRGWRNTRADGSMLSTGTRRFMSDAVLLPDRTVLIVGGAGIGRDDFNSNPVFGALSFESETEQFRVRASAMVERRYHATALLLPDGRVVTAGSSGGWPGPPWEPPHPSSKQYRLEVFTPPYLFRGPRPRITSLGAWQWSYGQSFSIGTDEPAEIGSVALMRTSSVTHTNDMDQRYVGLSITFRGPDYIRVQAPMDSTFAPPGVYMLFLVRGNNLSERVPSLAKFVELS